PRRVKPQVICERERYARLDTTVARATRVGGLTRVEWRDVGEDVVRDAHVVDAQLIGGPAGHLSPHSHLDGVHRDRLEAHAVGGRVLLEQLALAGRTESVAVGREEARLTHRPPGETKL